MGLKQKRFSEFTTALLVIFLMAICVPAKAQLHAHAADAPAPPSSPVILPSSPNAQAAPETPATPDTGGDILTPAPQAIFSNNPQTGAVAAPADLDPNLTTHTSAVQCAIALIVEGAGQKHQTLNNPVEAAYQSGLCTGKIQSYMLEMQAANPNCFPKIELEEGIRMFVKWVEAHPEEGKTQYLEGFRKAFEDGVPCLKK